jgi:SAM-dependent methyltransferase
VQANPPATELTDVLRGVPSGRALDLACGSGRHSIWLRDKGWSVTAIDLAMDDIDGVTCMRSDLERHEYVIEPGNWDLIVCWLYWQEDLLPSIAAGVRPGGIVALAGKLTGRFATSLERYRGAFAGWEEIGAGEDVHKAYFMASKPRRPTRP